MTEFYMRFGPEKRFVQCPYFKEHAVDTNKSENHLVFCRRIYQNRLGSSAAAKKERRYCRFNADHTINNIELKLHEAFLCPDRRDKDPWVPTTVGEYLEYKRQHKELDEPADFEDNWEVQIRLNPAPVFDKSGVFTSYFERHAADDAEREYEADRKQKRLEQSGFYKFTEQEEKEQHEAEVELHAWLKENKSAVQDALDKAYNEKNKKPSISYQN